VHEHGELLPTQTVEMTPGAVSSGGGGGAEGSAGAGSADGGDGSNAVASELESFSAAGGSEGDAFGVESTATPTLFFSEVTVEDPDGALDDDDEEEDDDEDEDDEEDDEDEFRFTCFLRVHVPSRTMPLSVAHFLNAEELKRFFTPFSVRPSKPFAMAAHLLP